MAKQTNEQKYKTPRSATKRSVSGALAGTANRA